MNAASSVLGSVLAIVIAIQFGLNVTWRAAPRPTFWLWAYRERSGALQHEALTVVCYHAGT